MLKSKPIDAQRAQRDAVGVGEIIQLEQRTIRRRVPTPSRERVPLERAAIALLHDCPALDNPALIPATEDLGRALIGLIRICKLPGI